MMDDLRQAVIAAAQRPEVLAAVDGLYCDVQAQIDLRKPVCIVSGRCCRFEQFGHRLYVTTIELAAFVHSRERERAGASESAMRTPPLASARGYHASVSTGCPFQIGKLCGVHAIRPFGCRIFFCDATAQDWQQEQYATFHARLKGLHEQLGVPYFYVEWRTGLGAIHDQGIGIAPATDRGS